MVFTDPQKIVYRFGEYIQEFQGTFAAHGISFGSPDDFFGFARNLKSNQPLQQDLSDLVRSLMERENGNISLRIVLSVMAIASGGPDVGLTDRDISRPVNLVIDFLVSASGCTQIDLDHLDNMYSMTYVTEDYVVPDQQNLSDDSSFDFDRPSHAHSMERHSSTGSTPGAGDLQTASGISPELNQSLARLELNSLEVKLYLDSIDQRISRIEPYLGSAQAPASATAAHVIEPETVDFTPTPGPEAHPLSSTSYDPDTEFPSDLHSQGQSEEHADASPFFHRETVSHRDRRRFFIPVLAGSAILAALLLYLPFRNGSSTPGSIDAAKTSTSSAIPSNTVSPTNNASNAYVKAPAGTPLTPDPGTAHAGFAYPRTDSNSTAAALTPNSSANVTPDTNTTAPAPLADTPARSHSETGDVPYTATTPRIGSLSSKTVSVSSGVMAANLISASVPSYPKVAKFAHMQGEVVLQAIISKQGKVVNLHVIKGHRLLRGAAIDTVKTWRYRPYYINSKPVEVATIVTVEFKLKH